MNKLLTTVAVSTALFGAAAAQAEMSANIGVTSNYVWRGATQTDDSAAVSGGVDFSHDSGIYAGTWASNVDFGSGGEVEWDLYAGFAGEAGSIGYDLGVVHYAYPDSDDADFTEFAASASVSMFTVGFAYTFNSDVTDAAGSAEAFLEGDVYYYASAGFDLQDDFGLGLTLGRYTFDDDGEGGTDLDYNHYQLDLTKAAGDFGDFAFSISKADKEANGGDDDAKVFVSWTKSF